MTPIFKCKFGSHIYGTNLPTSDLDYKSIFLPSVKDILLQRVPDSIHQNTKSDETMKNGPDDVDHEMFSLQKYLKLLAQGQTVSLDMLFTPKEFIITSSPIWNEIVANKDKFLHKGVSAFIGYTKAQAAKYGVKGFRVAAVEAALDFMIELKMTFGNVRLSKFDPAFISTKVDGINNEHLSVVLIDGAAGSKELALNVCDRKIPFHATVGYVEEVLQKIYDNYGHRAKLAQNNEGIDWKALMHAVRVARESIELLTTGNITFPRPEKELLLKIRQGQMAYQQVAEIIEQGLIDVNKAVEVSKLPAQPDFAWMDKFVEKEHLMYILDERMWAPYV